MILSATYRDLLFTLTHKIRCLSLDQARRTWWFDRSSSLSIARRHFSVLVRDGYLKCGVYLVQPEISLSAPAVAWRPGEPDPDIWKVSYRLQSRWTLPPKSTKVFQATSKAAKHFGGFGESLRNIHQVTHDLHVSTVYLKMRLERAALAEDWLSEEFLSPPKGEKKPDAVLRDHNGLTYRVIEFGGSYDAVRVGKFHDYCRRKSLEYELW